MTLRLLLVPLGAVPAMANAADAAPAAPASVTGSLLSAVLGLAVVLGVILAAAWLMRRVQPSLAGRQNAIKIVAAQSVGQRERVVLVEVAEQWLVLGVAPGNVRSLATLPKGTLPPAPAPSTFAGLLARARREPTTP